MDIREIKEFMAAMRRFGTKRLRLKRKDMEIEIEREENGKSTEAYPHYPQYVVHERAHHPAQKPDIPPSLSPPVPLHEKKEDEKATYITSPMVGTFYSSPSPEDPPFVKVGEKVDESTVVGIVEAMKVMNEVKAGISGTIAEVMLTNNHPVEFGSKLFRIT